MAILAMCFDLMQEEIVAKFRWIGTKIGIIEKDEENNNQPDKLSDTKNKGRSSLSSSLHDQNSTKKANHEIADNENDFPRPRSSSSATRKNSPRNNIARVHPVEINGSNEATLHQRLAATKPY